jgi:hypothetical protein
MIACDGNRSAVRERLGIAMRGKGLISHSVTIYFRAEAGPLLAGRKLGVIYVTNDELRGFVRLERSGKRGFLAINTVGDVAKPEATRIADDITEARCIELVRTALGVPDIPVEITDVAKWRAVAENAETYREGNVFVAGDAAHTMPPNGGFGGNTGVQDAHNLAWKLAVVLSGAAGAGLLDTYDTERRPLGGVTVEQAYSRYVRRSAPYLGTDTVQPVIDDWRMEIGYRYRSAAVIPEAEDDGGMFDDPRQSRARPGTRAPHLYLAQGGRAVSTLDLFGRNFVLLAGADGRAWCEGARRAARRWTGLGLDTYRIGPDGDLGDEEQRFATDYGIAASGAVLVRPDGFVAWRARELSDDPEAVIAGVLGSILSRRERARA